MDYCEMCHIYYVDITQRVRHGLDEIDIHFT